MTASETQRFSLRARYVFPMRSPPIENGIVHVQDGRVVGIETFRGQLDVQDAGDVGLLPALVNAHTHLEFSDLSHPLGHAGMPFCPWIRAVIAHRQSAAHASSANGAAIRQGLRESSQARVDYLGEITTAADTQWYAHPPTGGILFHELMGLGPQRIADAQQRALTFLATSPPAGWMPGLSPHAPYTAALELVRWCAKQGRSRQVPIAMHLAETNEEQELLANQMGPLRELLVARGVWEPHAFRPRQQFADYLQALASGWKSLVIHGNYLSAADRHLLAQKRDVLSVVYCPRTHAFFGHANYPLAEMLAAGVRVAVGTDSRASNPDLNVWNELIWIAEHHPQIDSRTIVGLATTAAAEALGLPAAAGTIVVGGPARFQRVPLRFAGTSTDNPYDALFGRSC